MDVEVLELLNSRIAGCTACRLCDGRTQTVPGDGDAAAELMFIGEGPGFNEDKQGRPFVGKAGQLLDVLLGEIGLSRAEVFVTNVVKCRPPQNRDPAPDEIGACEVYLREQLEGIRPKLIVPLGRFAMQYFLPGEPIGRRRGRAAAVGDWTIYPVYHPAAALRQGAMMTSLREDFARIPQLLEQLSRPQPAPTSGPHVHHAHPPAVADATDDGDSEEGGAGTQLSLL